MDVEVQDIAGGFRFRIPQDDPADAGPQSHNCSGTAGSPSPNAEASASVRSIGCNRTTSETAGPKEEYRSSSPESADICPAIKMGLSRSRVGAGLSQKSPAALPWPERKGERDRDVQLLQGWEDGGRVTEHVDVPEIPNQPAPVKCAGGLAESNNDSPPPED